MQVAGVSRALLFCPFVLWAAGCGRLTTPAGPSSDPATGNWAGKVSIQQQLVGTTWTLTQSGSQVAGEIRITLDDGSELLHGTLSGALSGQTLTYRIDVPAGGFAEQPACTGHLDGTAMLLEGTPSTLIGNYTMSSGCPSGLSTGTFVLSSGPAAGGAGGYRPS